jgi:hypothetical protein
VWFLQRTELREKFCFKGFYTDPRNNRSRLHFFGLANLRFGPSFSFFGKFFVNILVIYLLFSITLILYLIYL